MKILITLDGSHLSEAALERAKDIVKATGAEVVLMRVGEPPPRPPAATRVAPSPPWTRDIRPIGPWIYAAPKDLPKATIETYDQTIERTDREMLEYLQDRAAILEGLPVKYRVAISKDAAEEIIRYAKEQEVDLIAMATHGRTGLAALLMGSVASAVVRSGVAPVMLVRPKAEELN